MLSSIHNNRFQPNTCIHTHSATSCSVTKQLTSSQQRLKKLKNSPWTKVFLVWLQ